MKITADTNVLVGAVMQDDATQGPVAGKALRDAELVAISLHALCEFVWVLKRSFKEPTSTIAAAVRRLISADNVVTNRPAVALGLAFLDAGGDFADGVILAEGLALGGEKFLSFDKTAIALAQRRGLDAALL